MFKMLLFFAALSAGLLCSAYQSLHLGQRRIRPYGGVASTAAATRKVVRMSVTTTSAETTVPTWRRLAMSVDKAQAKVWSRAKGLPPMTQFFWVIVAYAVHTALLQTKCFAFPVQLIPNDAGLFQSLGYDSAAGLGVLLLRGAHVAARPREEKALPWRTDNAPSKRRFAVVLGLLLAAYLGSGFAAVLVDDVIYDNPAISAAMQTSIAILVSHLVWIATGASVLAFFVDSFWRSLGRRRGRRRQKIENEDDLESTQTTTPPPPPATNERNRWFRLRLKEDWLLWAVGGYYFSWFAFNAADAVNQFLIPDALFDDDDSVVARMIHPEDNDVVAMAAGAVAPCLTAPFWEEFIYRGFLLPAIAAYAPLWKAIPASALIFSVHHWTLTAGLPLAVLGFVWAKLYIQSRNLLVTILIHGMWNTRVFIGALFGL